MSDLSSDEYHHGSPSDEYAEDSLPDLVLSSPYLRYSSEKLVDEDDDLVNYSLPPAPDLVLGEEMLNIHEEYFQSGDQITSSYGESGMRVSYSDHSKPYLPKISCSDAYRSFLNLTEGSASDEEDTPETVSQQFMSLSLENAVAQREEWRVQLNTAETEITSLRKQILQRVRRSNELKERLGMTAWREFSTDFKEGLRAVQESEVYQRVEESISDIGETITEFKDIIKKDLDSVKEKACKELILVKEKAASELQSAQKKTTESIAIIQKRASTAVRTTDAREYREVERIDTSS